MKRNDLPVHPIQTPRVHIGDADFLLSAAVVSADTISSDRLTPLFPVTRILSRERSEAVAIRQRAEDELAAGRRRLAHVRRKLAAHSAAMFARARQSGRQLATADLTRILSEVDRQLMELGRNTENRAVALALELAKRVVSDAFEQEPNRIVVLARAALQRARQCRSILIRVHPDDALWLAVAAADLVASVPDAARFEIIADETLPPRSLILETDRGGLDLSIDTQWRQLEQSLLPKDALQ